MVRAVVTPTLLAGALALAVAGCTPEQAPAMRTSGKVMSLGGVAGIVGAAFATNLTDKANEMMIGFEVISAVGILTYAYAELTWPRVHHVQETPEQRHHRWARILTERAAGAARESRCARVRRLEVRVQKYDRVIHDVVFMKDPEILKCLGAPESPVEAPPAETPPAEAPPAESPPEPPLEAPP
jgi:hypothetical protein